MHKIFRYPNFSETVKKCPRSFSALLDKKFSTKSSDTPIMHETFRYPKFSETLKGCPPILSAVWDLKFYTEKRDTPIYK